MEYNDMIIQYEFQIKQQIISVYYILCWSHDSL